MGLAYQNETYRQHSKRMTCIATDEAIRRMEAGEVVCSDYTSYWQSVLYELNKRGYVYQKGRLLGGRRRAVIWKWSLHSSEAPLSRSLGNVSCGAKLSFVRGDGKILLDY